VLRLLAPAPHEQWLEIGCGRGFLTRDLSERGVHINGTDANPHSIENAVTDRVKQMAAEQLDYPPHSFDAVIAVHALEHMPDLAAVLAEISRVLKPGGKALFIYPAEPVHGLYAMPSAFTLLGNPFKARQVHCQWLWPAKMRKLAKLHGLEQVSSEFQLFATPQFVSVFQKV
jgi:ubiquinone/menaquinone biosynthesis C-methylase UbiE